ncbi:MAG TPA: hypothetical protein VKX49_30305 [Bryobacteraceae bacterium]|nr:hypothetical protein [Bryobacteraceae bacterium]
MTTKCNFAFIDRVSSIMYGRIASLLLLSVLAWCAEPFPTIECEDLRNDKITIPEATKGHAEIFVIGFTHASQTQTKAWTAKLEPEVHPYSIAVLQDAPRLVRGMAVHGIKSSVPQAERDRFLLVFHGEEELKQAAGFDRPDDAYLVLIDANGQIRWRFHGPFSEDTLAEVKHQMANAR